MFDYKQTHCGVPGCVGVVGVGVVIWLVVVVVSLAMCVSGRGLYFQCAYETIFSLHKWNYFLNTHMELHFHPTNSTIFKLRMLLATWVIHKR